MRSAGAFRVENLGRRPGEPGVRGVDGRPAAGLLSRLDPRRSPDVREEHFLDEERRHAFCALHGGTLGEAGHHRRERVLAEELLRLAGQPGQERVHHHDGRLSFEKSLEREETVGRIMERLEPAYEVEAAVLQRVRQLVSQERVLEQGFGREAESGSPGPGRCRLGRPLGYDEKLLFGGIVEAGDLSRVERRELLLEARLGVEKADGREGGGVARKRGRKVFDELRREHASEVFFVQDRRRDGPGKRHAPDFLDELLGSRHGFGESLGDRALSRARVGRGQEGGQERESEAPDRWTARRVLAYHAPAFRECGGGNHRGSSLAARLLVHFQ